MKLNDRERKALHELRDGNEHSSRHIASHVKMFGHRGKICVMMKGLARLGLVESASKAQFWKITEKGLGQLP